MKRFCLTFLSFFVIIGLHAQSDSSKVASADMILLKEESFDFGKIPQGKPVHHNFEVRNISDSILRIENVQASCGCTTPEWDRDKSVPPAGVTQIRVGYNAAAEGPFSKVITITYNGEKTRIITIKGEVWKTPTASAPANSAANDLKE